MAEDYIVGSLTQPRQFPPGGRQFAVVQDYPRMRVGELADDRCQDCGRRGHSASDSHFSARWIGQELNVSDAQLQLVKRSKSTLEECAAIDSGFDALGRAIEKPYTKRMLEVGDHLRNARLRYPEVGG